MANSITFSGEKCHSDSPTLGLWGTFIASRSNEQSETITISGSNLQIGSYYSGYSWKFLQGSINIAIKYGGTTKKLSTHNYEENKHPLGPSRVNYPNGSVTFSSTSRTGTITIIVQCRFTSSGCQISHSNNEYQVGSFTFDLPYNPVVAPSVSLSVSNVNNNNADIKRTLNWTVSTGNAKPDSGSLKLYLNDTKGSIVKTIYETGLTESGGKNDNIDLEAIYKNDYKGLAVKIIAYASVTNLKGTATSSISMGNFRWSPNKKIPTITLNKSGYIIESSKPDITLSWNYPIDKNNGIVDSVHIVGDNDLINTTTSKVTSASTSAVTGSKLISKNSYLPMVKYTIQVYPRYSTKNLEYQVNPNKVWFMFVSKLSALTISYPKDNFYWIGSRIYLCFTLPSDPDYQNNSSYVYKDIIIRMNDQSGNFREYSFKINKDMFSCNNLSYQRKVIFSNKIGNINDSTNPFKSDRITISIKVIKNVDTSIEEATASSTSINLYLMRLPSYTSGIGNYIGLQDFKNLCTTIFRMGECYDIQRSLDDNISLTNVNSLTQLMIKQSHYSGLHSILHDIIEKINSYSEGKIDNASFIMPVLSDLINLSNEKVTSNYSQNYIKLGYNWIKQLMNSGDYSSRLPYTD